MTLRDKTALPLGCLSILRNIRGSVLIPSSLNRLRNSLYSVRCIVIVSHVILHSSCQFAPVCFDFLRYSLYLGEGWKHNTDGIDQQVLSYEGVIPSTFPVSFTGSSCKPCSLRMECHRVQSLPFFIYSFGEFIHTCDFTHHPGNNFSQNFISRPNFFINSMLVIWVFGCIFSPKI